MIQDIKIEPEDDDIVFMSHTDPAKRMMILEKSNKQILQNLEQLKKAVKDQSWGPQAANCTLASPHPFSAPLSDPLLTPF